MNGYPKSRTKDLVVSEMADELLVYDLKTDKCHCLNKTAYFIWQNCDGKTTPNKIAAKLDTNAPADSVEHITIAALAKLERADLLEGSTIYAGMIRQTSRREVIRRLSLAGAVALPVVSSIVAPTAATAQSGCPSGIVCSISRTCCPTGQRCILGTDCCPNAQGCGSQCCPSTQSCVGGTTCCPPAQRCLTDCCAPGQSCNRFLVCA